VIPRERTSLPVDFQELLKSLDRVLADVPPGETRRLVQNLAGGLGGREDEISTILESLATLSDSFASVAEEQKRLLDNSTTVGSEFLRTKDEFSAALAAADEVFAGIGDEPEELRRFLAANDRLAREGIQLLARSGNNLRAGIDALADLTDYQVDHRVDLEQSLTYVPQFLKAIEEASVPWRDPDGSTFYRIRVGLVVDNENERSWPCKYQVPDGYARMPHLRDRQRVYTGQDCVPAETERSTRALIDTLQDWADEERLGPPVSLAEAFDSATDHVSEMAFVWPLDGYVSSHFGERGGEMHTGIDIDGTSGEPIAAAAGGTVTASGHDDGGYGNVVVVDHGDGYATMYAHLSALDVEVGGEVAAGDPLGAVGCSGSCDGDHLHFEIRIDGEPVDPLLYLPGGRLFYGDEEPEDEPGTAPAPSPTPSATGDPSLETIFGLDSRN
ncbi:MAG: peptidoglycan DD-metalloendopeptidase family protein, partial [Actinomycetota bacterium]